MQLLISRLLPCLSTLALAALLVVGAAILPTQAAEMNEAKKQEIESLVRDYILNNPEILIRSLETFRITQEKTAKEQERANLVAFRDQLNNDPTSPVTGNLNGDVTIVEFFDYRCGFCKRVFPSVMKALKSDGNVRLVLKEFPILGPESVTASKAALAAWTIAPDKYDAYHQALMLTRGGLPESRVLEIADSLGIDSAKIKSEMNSPEIEAIIRKNYKLAESLGISGTPAFVVGGTLVPGAIDLAALMGLIADARSNL